MSKRRKGQIVILSGITILVSYGFKFLDLNPIYQNILLIVATLISGFNIIKNALQALRYKYVGIEALVSVAVIGALAIGEYFESAAVTFLFVFGAYLEAKTLEKTRQALKSLMDLAPNKAFVIRDNKEIEVLPEEVQINETVIIKPGGKIPVDGIVLKGVASINQAAITGESLPISKKTGDAVFSGTVLESGYLEVEAIKVGCDTSFSRIIQLVEEAQDTKAKTQKFIEKFASFYTPGIMLLSLVVYIITLDVELTLTLLVIACPGALVISTPVSFVAGIGNGAKRGILIKGGEYLEKASKIDLVAFDKTGTLTIGKPKVKRIQSFEKSEMDVLKIAARLEMNSEHHLGKAIIQKAKESNIDIVKAQDFEPFSGKGVKGMIDGTIYYIGNRKLLNELNIPLSKEIEESLQSEELKGQTVVLVSNEVNILGMISISDIIRNDAYSTLKLLKQNGIKKVIMLTGDNDRVAKAVGLEVGIDEVYSELLPEDKLSLIQNLQKHHKVAMIGDGVNDAPSLALADLGISMGDVGSDVANETADVVLLNHQLSKINEVFALSKATRRNLIQNLSFALFVVFTLLLGVILGRVFMSLGMLIHEISVILVILNAIRLNHFKYNRGEKT